MHWSASNSEQVLQHTKDILSGEVAGNFYGKALTCVFVNHNEKPKATTIFRTVLHEVIRPNMILVLCPITDTAVLAAAGAASATMLLSRHLHLFLLPESVNTLVVNRPVAG
jgi:hypothetical protein